MAAASAIMMPARIMPCPPEPLNRISYLSLILKASEVFAALSLRARLFLYEDVVLLAVRGPIHLVQHAPEHLARKLLGREIGGLLHIYGAVLFDLFHHLGGALELVGPAVVCRAGVDYVHDRGALVHYRLVNDLFELDGVVRRAPGNESSPGCLRHLAGVKRRLDVAVAAGRGYRLKRRRRRILAAGHAVGGVGEYQH